MSAPGTLGAREWMLAMTSAGTEYVYSDQRYDAARTREVRANWAARKREYETEMLRLARAWIQAVDGSTEREDLDP